MMLAPHDSPPVAPGHSACSARRWRPVDVAVLVAVACYGTAIVIVAAGLFVRLAH
jgi:hypothetical protein